MVLCGEKELLLFQPGPLGPLEDPEEALDFADTQQVQRLLAMASPWHVLLRRGRWGGFFLNYDNRYLIS